jgi:hypothetical protein
MQLPNIVGVLLAVAAVCRAGVVINEFQAAPNEILLESNGTGMGSPGYGPAWWELGFSDESWTAGTAPLGHSAAGLGTTVIAMDDRTPSLCVRRSFAVTAGDAAQGSDLMLRVWYDDGFTAWINGREVARANLGPPGQYTYRHQVSYRATTEVQPVEYNLGPAAQWLRAGENVLALQVANRDLGSGCRADAALYFAAPAVLRPIAADDFGGANGASRTVRRTGASVVTTVSGEPPAGSWLVQSPDPLSDPAWESLVVTSALDVGAGIGGTGAMKWQFGATGVARAVSVFGPGIRCGEPGASGLLTPDDLARTEIRFRYRVSSGAQFAFRLEPEPGNVGSALSGFPVLLAGAGVSEDAVRSYATNSGGVRTRIVNAAGSGSTASAGTVLTSAVLSHGSTLRNAVFRIAEDTAAGAGGTAGVLRMEWTDAADAPDAESWGQVALPGFTVRNWIAGSVTAADMARVNLVFQHRLAKGQQFRVFLEPDHASAGFADRADFGIVSGSGEWSQFDQSFAEAGNTSAMISRLNALRTTTFRLVLRLEPGQPVGEPLWIDNPGFSSAWRTYAVSLGSAPVAARTAFLAAMNAAGRRVAVPALARQAGLSVPLLDELVMDDFSVRWRESGGSVSLVNAASGGWRYFVGRCEPSGGLTDPGNFNDPAYDGDWHDWVELHNDGTEPVDVGGWSLTDDARDPAKWKFPAGAVIPGGGYLVVICDGRTTPLAGARYLHASFELSAGGEHLSLRDAAGVVVSEIAAYPPQNAFHTFGRRPGGGMIGWLRHGTPGRANDGPFRPAAAEAPQFSVPGGFHASAVTVVLSSATEGAQIRYTTDGSDPGEASSLFTAPLVLNAVGSASGHCLRARAFVEGGVPSEVRTQTSLIAQDARLRSVPAVVLTGDPGRSLFKPYGITAIEGGVRDSNGVWSPTGVHDYSNVLGDLNNALTGGQAWERPVHLALQYPDGRAGIAADCGLRISGSGHARPRFTLNGIQAAPWSYTSYLEKPSFNVFFRGEYGSDGVEHDLFPKGYPVNYFEHFRVRAGKNDVSNPFIKDEYMRRVYLGTGQQGARGLITTLYVNGKFRGTYNLTERLREPFMRQHFRSNADWDVRQVQEIASGDAVAFNSFKSLLDAYAADSGNQTKYSAAVAQLDVDAYIDYALVNIWGGTGDWPHNNYVVSRERSAQGKWRWFVWDAEGAFGGFSKHLGYNVITQDLLVSASDPGREICQVYDRLSRNAEFRLRFADRIHRHFCNGGALSDARLTALKDQLVAEYQPMFSYMFPASTLNLNWFTSWVASVAVDKRDVLFRSALLDDPATGAVDSVQFGYQFPRAGLWPAVDGQGSWAAPLPPLFSQHGGDVAQGYALGMQHTVADSDRTKDAPYRAVTGAAPAGRIIYFTWDGSDPRVTGGAVAAGARTWTAPVVLPAGFVSVRARIRDAGTGQWSPLTAADFRVGTEAASSANLVVAEIMYHAPEPTAVESANLDSGACEFVRVMNAGNRPVRLSDCRFVNGITYDFAEGSVPVLDPGKSVLVVADRAAFRSRYGEALAALVVGQYAGSLGNAGERLRLERSDGMTVVDFAYDDNPPWPEAADGMGASLVLRNPSSFPDHGRAENWLASALPGGMADWAVDGMNYGRWRSLYWSVAESSQEQVSGMMVDSDGDGVVNLLEYAVGSHPRRADQPGPRAFLEQVSGAPVLGIEFRMVRGLPGVTLEPEYSSDLSAWSLAPEWSPPVAVGDGSLRCRHYAPSGARYLRLRAVAR